MVSGLRGKERGFTDMKRIRERNSAIEESYFYRFFRNLFRDDPVDIVSKVYWTKKNGLYVEIDKDERSFEIYYGYRLEMRAHGEIDAISGLAESSDSIIVTSYSNKGFISFEIPKKW